VTWLEQFQQAAARRRIRAMRAELEAVYRSGQCLASRGARLEELIAAAENALVPEWSPLVEYAPGERVRMRDGAIYTVSGPQSPGVVGAVPRSRREAFGHDAPLTTYERKVGTWLVRVLVALGGVALAAVYAVADHYGAAILARLMGVFQ
jgi:hypothetical protein